MAVDIRQRNTMRALTLGVPALVLVVIAVVGWVHTPHLPTVLEVQPGEHLLAAAIKDLVLDKAKPVEKPQVKVVKELKAVKAPSTPNDVASRIPNLEEAAIAQLFTKPTTQHSSTHSNSKEEAAETHLGTVAAVQEYQEQQEKDALLEKEKMEREEGLPAFGTKQYKVDLAKAQLDESWSKLKIAKLKQKRDSTIAGFQEFEEHGYDQARQMQKVLAFRERREERKAKELQARAQEMTEAVVRDLNVEGGKFDIHRWSRSEAARKASEDSTRDVHAAKRMWALAMRDRSRLRALDSEAVFREHQEKLSGAEVALRVSQRRIAAADARLAAARQRLHDLREESPRRPQVQAPPAHKQSKPQPQPQPQQPAAVSVKPAEATAAPRKARSEKPHAHKQESAQPAAQATAKAGGVREAEGEGRAALAADERRAEGLVAEEMEGGGRGRLEELASSEEAIRAAEREGPKRQGLRESTGDRVAAMVFEDAKTHRALEKEGYAHQKLPLLERKLIFNW